ncbi:MAG: ATP-binding protein [Candidatus Diapherotrites archaeon]|nr:ATP-binding protein [Candidatus Diapherotrites archaeon]
MEELSVINDPDTRRILLGRKASLYSREGFRGALHIGRVDEDGPFKGWDVYVDALYPHVIFVAGARGSGKSYTLGVFVEELAEKNPYVGTIVIDPVGIYWSMKLPNRQSDEIRTLTSWGLTPKGYDNVRIFIPVGAAKDVPKGTYDALFSLKPSMLTVEDWALTFGVDRFSPSGMLLEKVLEHVHEEYGEDYSLEDIIHTLEEWEELRDKDRGFKPDTIRAILSRFYAARSWGVFSETGTALSDLSKPGIITVIDVSFLEENVGALVIGVLARRILQARKIATRQEAAKILDLPESRKREIQIPPTWLIIDEAHTLMPSGGKKTPATDALIEYVKQGRRPGCSLIFATQQPAAIDSRVLSQLDMLFVHKLVFTDDVRAVEKRMPTVLPKEYQGVFVKRLPIGVAIVGDRADTTSRALLVRVRPRRSQHEGREIAVDASLEAAQTEEPVSEPSSPPVPESDAGIKDEERNDSMAVTRDEGKVRALVSRIMEDKARALFSRYKHGLLGRVLGGGNEIVSMELKFIPVWEVEYSVFSQPRNVLTGITYIDGYHGEFIHVVDGKIVFSRGLKHIYKLPRMQSKIIGYLYAVQQKGLPAPNLSEIIAKGHIPAEIAERDLALLRDARFVVEKDGRYFLNMDLMLPYEPTDPVLASFGRLLVSEMTIAPEDILSANFGKERVKDLLPALWPGVVVKKIGVIYRPVWVGVIKHKGKQYKVFLDAVTGVFEKELPLLGAK